MKKMILTLISFLPFSSISLAANIKLNELTRQEKIVIIQNAIDEGNEVDVNEIQDEKDLDYAIKELLINGDISFGAEAKKGSGAESAGHGGG